MESIVLVLALLNHNVDLDRYWPTKPEKSQFDGLPVFGSKVRDELLRSFKRRQFIQ